MNHNILFIGYDSMLEPEIREYISDKASKAFFANTSEQAIEILSEQCIQTALLNLRSLKDAVIMRYINRYYPETKVVISATREMDEIIDIFNNGNFSLLKQPLTLDGLGDVL